MLKIVTEMSSSSVASGLSPYGGSTASAIRDAREREKKEMSDLNDKLASYIEKVTYQLDHKNVDGIKNIVFLHYFDFKSKEESKFIKNEITFGK